MWWFILKDVFANVLLICTWPFMCECFYKWCIGCCCVRETGFIELNAMVYSENCFTNNLHMKFFREKKLEIFDDIFNLGTVFNYSNTTAFNNDVYGRLLSTFQWKRHTQTHKKKLAKDVQVIFHPEIQRKEIKLFVCMKNIKPILRTIKFIFYCIFMTICPEICIIIII